MKHVDIAEKIFLANKKKEIILYLISIIISINMNQKNYFMI